ncbi:MAG: Zn-dependent hydrolase, partial [Rhodoferax sp.]|nr:Zn-dependent hydrolase [Rhodoferax sp.]
AASPVTAADILPVLFRRKLDVHQTTFAMGEAIAHLHKLWRDGDLVRADAQGVMRFSLTPQGQAWLAAQPLPAAAGNPMTQLPVSA